MSRSRGKFGSQFAVIMAMAGSAIGLGNIWRFPYIVGQYGGAAFILVYLICIVLVSLPVFFAESTIGKYTGKSIVGALEQVAPRISRFGFVPVLANWILLSFYCVVGGWSVAYLVKSVTVGFAGMDFAVSASVFSALQASTWQPLVYLVVFLALTAIIVAFGVEKGIGGFSKVMMPVLFVLIVGIVVKSVSLPGAKAGIEYLLKPDFGALSGRAIAAAMGQSFFSLSLGVGMVLTYSSYMKSGENIFHDGLWTALFDTIFALLASFAIMPAVFASGIEPAAGPSLVFETLPVIFSQMGPVVPVVFFLAILLAALTSSISILEVCVAYFVDQKGTARWKAIVGVFAACLVLGAACAVFPKVFAACDFATSNILMMFGALMFVIIVGWVMKKETVQSTLTKGGTSESAMRLFPVVYFLIKWVAPVAIVAIAISNLV